MITLIEGGFFAGGKEKIKNLIADRVKLGKKSILIVPEQQTVNAEREMTDILPPSASLCFEATNFTRFANTVFRTLGGLAKESADSSKRALIMWRTLTELSPVLESVRNSKEISAGTVSRMLGAVGQMQNAALFPSSLADAADELEAATGNLSDRRLTAKLRDIAKIMTLYKELLSKKFSDSEDELMLAAEKLSFAERDYLTDTEIFIDGFTSFTEPQYRILGELIKRCDVTLSLILPMEALEAYEFSETRSTHQKILKLASSYGKDARLEKIGGINTSVTPLICDISSLLWRSFGKLDSDFLNEGIADGSVKIFEAENPHEECDFIAADIKRRVMAGAKYSEFGIIARSVSPYEGILETAFDKANIPLFISSRSDIASYEVIKLIYSAFSIISGGYDRRDVISYSKCSLSGVSDSLADEFELYTEKWQINGNRFTDGITWNMNPNGYTAIRTERDEEKLLLIDQAREAIISPIVELEESLSDAKTIKEYTVSLVQFLTRLNIEERLLEKSRDAQKLLGSNAAEDLEKLWQLICDAFDSLCDILGDLNTTPSTYLNLLKIAFSETDIGRIPAFAEQVAAANADTARLSGKKHIYIMGANAGEFPASAADDSYFTDSDKKALSSIGLSLEADTGIRSARELYLFTRAVSYASHSLTITYHESDTSFKATAPSDAIIRIKELSEGKISPIKIAFLPLSERAYAPEYALEHLMEAGAERDAFKSAIADAGLKDRLDISEKNIQNSKLKLSKDSLSLLYGKKVRMTQSKLEKYVKCPMSYFCSYNLSIKGEERIEFDARNIGNFLHAVLENFFGELKNRGMGIAETSDQEREELIRRVADGYVSECFFGIPKTSARIKNTVDKLCRSARPIIDSLCDEFSDCKYEPTFFELEIDNGKNAALKPSVFNTDSGKEVYLSGKIDRVDVYNSDAKTYVRVIDYKSGSKLFSPDDIEKGLNLQMFLYLKSVVESNDETFRKSLGASDDTRLIPAGVIYVKTDISEPKIAHNNIEDALTAVKKNQARMGILLDDEESIGAMNPNFIPVKYKADGTLDSRSKAKVYTDDGWDKISQTVNGVVSDICERILDGDIPAEALKEKGGKSPCTYCDFKAICRNVKI